MLVALTAALMLTAAPQPTPSDNEVAPAIVQAPKRWPGVVPTDLEITNQLAFALKTQPDKVVCLNINHVGTRLPRQACKTLRAWYNFEADRDAGSQVRDVVAILDDMPGGGDEIGARLAVPPYELVELIKDRYRSPSARALAMERAKARLHPASRSPADPRISNP